MKILREYAFEIIFATITLVCFGFGFFYHSSSLYHVVIRGGDITYEDYWTSNPPSLRLVHTNFFLIQLYDTLRCVKGDTNVIIFYHWQTKGR